MRKPEKISIKVDEPCREDWKQMTQTEKGRHCASCDKLVVDFSAMTDQQLVEYFKNFSGNTCGHFRSTQLARPLTIPQQASHHWLHWPRMIAASLLAAMSWLSVPAFPLAHALKTELHANDSNHPDAIPAPEFQVIKGTVISLDQNISTENLRISLSGTSLHTFTDEHGNFKLSIPYNVDLSNASVSIESGIRFFKLVRVTIGEFMVIEIGEPLKEGLMIAGRISVDDGEDNPKVKSEEGVTDNFYYIDGNVRTKRSSRPFWRR